MREDIAKLLGAKTQNKHLAALLQDCKDKVESSRSQMEKYYAAWDFADDVYRSRRKPDEQDKKAAKRKEPMKMILPMTKSQVETFAAFGTRLVTQRPFLFELVPASDEDVVPSQMGMCTLERDLAHNKFKGVLLPQFFRNVAKYGVAILKESWVREMKETKQMVPDPNFVPDPNLPPVEPPMVEQVTSVPKYIGNKIVTISPYKFFPDPCLPLTRFQEGEFCASEEEQSFSYMEQLQREGTVAGIEHVRRYFDNDVNRRCQFAQKGPNETAKNGSRYGVLTEIQLNCIPSQTMIDEGVPLDKKLNSLTKCLVWYMNDDRIVRIETDMGYDHDEFTYSVAQYNNDGDEYINGGLAEDIGALQETSTWFINAHVTSVRKVIDNKLIVDPKFVEMQDLIDRKSVIRSKPGASQNGMERWFQQLVVQDVTGNHVKDVEYLNGAGKEATGINENLMGQFASGRRSAREAANVNSNSAARIVLTIMGVWDIALDPLGRRLLCNLRQGLDVPQLVRIYGETRTMVDQQKSLMTDPQGIGAVGRFLPVDKSMLVGNYDFEIFDGTLPSQRGAMAMTLREVLVAMAGKPESIPILGFDPQLLLQEILELSDVRNVNRLRLTPQRLQQFMQMAGAAGNAGGAQAPQGPQGRPA